MPHPRSAKRNSYEEIILAYITPSMCNGVHEVVHGAVTVIFGIYLTDYLLFELQIRNGASVYKMGSV